ncbi:hypothetical protein L208DRAFT_1410049, partial [Tricholoma matsutake]
LPSLQHISHHEDSEIIRLQTHWPTDCKRVVNLQVIALDDFYFSSLDVLQADSAVLQPGFHKALTVPHPQDVLRSGTQEIQKYNAFNRPVRPLPNTENSERT